MGEHFEWSRTRVDVLWPPPNRPELKVNDTSLVLRLNACGRSVLFCGDIERIPLRELAAMHDSGQVNLKSDVLIAPHHGSTIPPETADFYARVAPQAVIVSCGHPVPATEHLVRSAVGAGCRVLNTYETGSVTIRILADGVLSVETPFVHSPGDG
jgi:competence protein ComEC